MADIHMNTARGIDGLPDIHMQTAKGLAYDSDVYMQTARGAPDQTVGKSAKALWEREILDSNEVKRKATVAQLFFLDYYFQTLGYLAARKERRARFDQDTEARNLNAAEYTKEFRSYCGRERVLLRRRRAKLHVDQFHIIAQVGQGGYGEVFLARKRETGEVCALKKMKKSTLFKMDEIRHVLVERDILTATKTEWLVRLLYAFQDSHHVYLAMEYVPGGDFRTLLNNSGVLKEEHARFYICEMFAAVNELHKLGYIHRDLKPENFLVDASGHVKLTDFGLATGALSPHKIDSLRKKLDNAKLDANLDVMKRSTMERRSLYRSIRQTDPRYADSVVGSPDYMAPEVLRGKPYSYSVDFWSLGCILFEFLAGFPPFSGITPDETWMNLKNWTKVLKRPHYDKEEDLIFNLSDVAWDGIISLIAHSSTRMSTLSQVTKHPFFTLDRPSSSSKTKLPPVPMDWSLLRTKYEPPFVPSLDSEIDTGYYDDFTSVEDMEKYKEVKEKQKNVDAVAEKDMEGLSRGVWVGFTFGKNGPGANMRGLGGGSTDDGALATIF
jgi:cell cycle protein kinase DBF2